MPLLRRPRLQDLVDDHVPARARVGVADAVVHLGIDDVHGEFANRGAQVSAVQFRVATAREGRLLLVHFSVLAVVVEDCEADEWDVSRRELDALLYGLARRRAGSEKVPATSRGRMEVPTQPFPRGADMKEKNPELEQLRHFTFGIQAAFIAAMGALIRTHQNPEALAQMLELYRQREQAYLENKPLDEHVLVCFQQMWQRVDMELQHTLKERQQQPPFLG